MNSFGELEGLAWDRQFKREMIGGIACAAAGKAERRTMTASSPDGDGSAMSPAAGPVGA
jgi:hypothetical protein